MAATRRARPAVDEVTADLVGPHARGIEDAMARFGPVATSAPGHASWRWFATSRRSRREVRMGGNAGGRATEAGMAFQAEVGAWVAAHLVADEPCGPAFGLGDEATPSGITFETGRGMDDVEVRLEPRGLVGLQCKTSLTMSPLPTSDFAHVVRQVVDMARDAAVPDGAAAAVLAIGPEAPARWSTLEGACRAFDGGGAWDEVRDALSGEARGALDVFSGHVAAAWPGGAPGPSDLARVARLFRVARLDVAPGGPQFREGARILAHGAFGDEVRGTAAMRDLVGICRDLIRTGAPATREGLLARLRAMRHLDTKAGRSERDVLRLREHTLGELERLDAHRALTTGGLVLDRARCQAALARAADGGSLLVVGEPGSGKTGLLLALAAARIAVGAPTVLLSVERHSGASTSRALQDDLGLGASLVEVLARWPGGERGVLLVDALDACRDGPSDATFAVLVQEATRLLGERWSVVASIRTFDLLAGGRGRLAFAGPAVDAAFTDPRLRRHRHLLVPPLDRQDLDAVRDGDPALRALLDRAPMAFSRLLGNAFNLSLAAELVEAGTDPESIGSASTQSELISLYEDVRLRAPGAIRAVAAVVRAIVERRSLSVREVDVEHDGVAGLLSSGVLNRVGDRVGFAHNVLFDHAAGRFHLDDGDPGRLLAQVSGASSGLILGPALRFALERMWRNSAPGRRETWAFARSLVAARASGGGCDPVVASVTLRAVAESVAERPDVAALADLLGAAARAPGERDAAALLSRLSRLLPLAFAERAPAPSVVEAWEDLAEAAIAPNASAFLDGGRMLLASLVGTTAYRPGPAFGRAARGLLASAWERPELGRRFAADAISYVGLAYATDPVASRALLAQVLEEPRFATHAHEEAPPLAAAVPHVAASDPEFAVRVFHELFRRPSPSSGPVPLGTSRIMGLRTTREQDYDMARHELRRALPELLRASPRTGLAAVDAACRGEHEEAGRPSGGPTSVRLGDRTVSVALLDVPASRVQASDGDPTPDDRPLDALGAFLGEATASQFRDVVEAAALAETTGIVWARVIEVANDRPGVVDDDLWPFASSWEVVSAPATVKQAVAFVARVHGSRDLGERRAFEERTLQALGGGGRLSPGRPVLARLASLVPEDDVATEDFREAVRALRRSGEARGNPWPMEVRTDWRPVGVRDILDLDGEEGDAVIVEAIERLDDCLTKATRGEAAPELFAGLWSATDAAAATLRDRAPGLASGSAWSYVGRAVLAVADRLHQPGGAPGVDPEQVAALALDLARTSRIVGVRAEAAAAVVSLVGMASAATTEALLAAVPDRVSDAELAVRATVVARLPSLRRRAGARLWTMAGAIADAETNQGVLACLVGRILGALVRDDAVRVEALATRVLERADDPAAVLEPGPRGRELDESLGGLAGALAVGRGSDGAEGWVGTWLDEMPSRRWRLSSLVFGMRDALFLGYRPSATEGDRLVWARARRMLDMVTTAATSEMSIVRQAFAAGTPSEGADALGSRFAAADQVLHRCCQQLFFGSGASGRQAAGKETTGLGSEEAKRRFLVDFRAPLDAMASGMPGTIHMLVKIYAFLVDSAPAEAFDAVARICVGSATTGGYHLEHLAASEVVRLVERYLVDHRGVLGEEGRRGRLVELLDLFAETGWPEASRLLHDLPELLR